MRVAFADSNNIPELAKLFDQYRVFYGEESNLQAAADFLESRLRNKDSVIIIANKNSETVGFIQLYPSFSSVGMHKIWILNDLFVGNQFRRQGFARELMIAAQEYANETGALRIDLATQISNVCAQKLYEALGYLKNESFYHYSLPVKI